MRNAKRLTLNSNMGNPSNWEGNTGRGGLHLGAQHSRSPVRVLRIGTYRQVHQLYRGPLPRQRKARKKGV